MRMMVIVKASKESERAAYMTRNQRERQLLIERAQACGDKLNPVKN